MADEQLSLQGWLSIMPDRSIEHRTDYGLPTRFLDDVRNYSQRYMNVSFSNVDNKAKQWFGSTGEFWYAAALYDAVFLYARAATEVIDNGKNVDGADHPNIGEALVAAMKNISFDGMAGHVKLDANGDLIDILRGVCPYV